MIVEVTAVSRQSLMVTLGSHRIFPKPLGSTLGAVGGFKSPLCPTCSRADVTNRGYRHCRISRGSRFYDRLPRRAIVAGSWDEVTLSLSVAFDPHWLVVGHELLPVGFGSKKDRLLNPSRDLFGWSGSWPHCDCHCQSLRCRHDGRSDGFKTRRGPAGLELSPTFNGRNRFALFDSLVTILRDGQFDLRRHPLR